MITYNEAHHIGAAIQAIQVWAADIYVVDSYSIDDTVHKALSLGTYVVQRKFKSFGDQWQYCMRHLPIRQPWTMKLEPDERISAELMQSLEQAFAGEAAGLYVVLRN